MGWAEKRPNGQWRGAYRDRHGNQQYLEGTFSSEAEAKRKANAKEDEVRARNSADVSPDNKKLTVGQWVDSHWTKRKVEPGTLKRDTSNLNTHILPYWEDKKLRDVTRDDVQEWVDALTVTRALNGPNRGARLKPATIVRIYLVFSGIFKAAIVGKPKMPYTPCIKIDLPKIEPPEEQFLTRSEFATLVAQAPNPETEMFCYLGVGTGMRYGEIMGLHRERIDLEQRMITVQETYDQMMFDIKGYPKSRKRRGIPISDELCERLARYMDEHPARPCPVAHRSHESAEQKSCRGSLLLMSSREGTEVRGTQFRYDCWGPMVRAAKMEYVTAHDLRHTYASWMIQGNPAIDQRGLTLDEVSELLGHSSVLVTKRYAHLAGVHWDRAREVIAGRPSPGGDTPDPGTSTAQELVRELSRLPRPESAPILLPTGSESGGAEIISLDRFRRKNG
jgi:integrase